MKSVNSFFSAKNLSNLLFASLLILSAGLFSIYNFYRSHPLRTQKLEFVLADEAGIVGGKNEELTRTTWAQKELILKCRPD